MQEDDAVDGAASGAPPAVDGDGQGENDEEALKGSDVASAEAANKTDKSLGADAAEGTEAASIILLQPRRPVPLLSPVGQMRQLLRRWWARHRSFPVRVATSPRGRATPRQAGQLKIPTCAAGHFHRHQPKVVPMCQAAWQQQPMALLPLAGGPTTSLRVMLLPTLGGGAVGPPTILHLLPIVGRPTGRHRPLPMAPSRAEIPVEEFGGEPLAGTPFEAVKGKTIVFRLPTVRHLLPPSLTTEQVPLPLPRHLLRAFHWLTRRSWQTYGASRQLRWAKRSRISLDKVCPSQIKRDCAMR